MEHLTAYVGKPVMVGLDLASKPDIGAMALKSREGTRVVLTTGKTVDLDREWMDGLDASHKDARECLCMALTMIAEARGAKVERRDEEANPGYSGAGIRLSFVLNGVGASMSIDNLHGGERALISWFNDHSGDAPGTPWQTRYFSPAFNRAVGETNYGSGGRPHHKATSGGSWFSLAWCLDAGLMLAARGEAFNAGQPA